MITIRHPDLKDPNKSVSNFVVSSVRYFTEYGHDKVIIWNRGGQCGHLLVNQGDGKKIAKLLLPDGVEER